MFALNYVQYSIALIDYIWVITIYSTVAFILAVIIDGHILPPYDPKATSKTSSPILAIEIIIQLAIQGFIAILLHGLLQKIPSPVHGIADYDANSQMGILLRNPAIISVILFALSRSLQGRLFNLFARFDKNTNKTEL